MMNCRQSGMTLIDVMVAVLLFSAGVLGLVALQAKSTQTSTNSESRTAAALLADEMAAYFVGNGGTVPATSDTTVSAWKTRVTNALPGGKGTLAGTSGSDMTITITWYPPQSLASGSSGGSSSDQYVTHVYWP